MRDPNVSLAWDPLDELTAQVRAQLENASTRRPLTAPAHSRVVYACTRLGAVDQFGHLTESGRALLDALRAGRPCHIPDQPSPWLPGGKLPKPTTDEASEDAQGAPPESSATTTRAKARPRSAPSSVATPRFRVSDAASKAKRTVERKGPATQASLFD